MAAGRGASQAVPPASAPNMKILTIYGENMTAQRGIVNVRLGQHSSPWVPGPKSARLPPASVFNFSEIDEGFSQYKMSSFIDLEAYNGFVYDSCHELTNGTRDCTGLRQPNALAPGWQSVMAKTIQASRSRLISGAIAGFFLGDEMVCNGLPISNFTNLVNFIKRTLTSAKLPGLVWANECLPQFFPGPQMFFDHLFPEGLDFIAFDACECMHSNTAPYDRLVLFPVAARERSAADAPFVAACRRAREPDTICPDTLVAARGVR